MKAFALIAVLLLAGLSPAAGLNEWVPRLITDGNGNWFRVFVPAGAELVYLWEENKTYGLHDANRKRVQFPTRGWATYSNRTGKVTTK